MRAIDGARLLLSLLGISYAYGLAILVLGAAGLLLDGDALPRWSWWQYLLAPLGVGLVALAAEALFLPIQKALVDPDRATDPRWKRGVRAGVLVVIFFGSLMMLAIYGTK